MSLAVQYQNPASVLIGATLAMLVADGIGIVVGVILCKRLLQRTIKWFSAIIFVVFGLVGVYQILSVKLNLVYTLSILVFLIVLLVIALTIIGKRQKTINSQEFKKFKKR